MRSYISEFSYGYALTEELVYQSGTSVELAPVFPSLIEEGKSGVGYDVKIDQSGIPLFLQFKLSDYMTGRANTQEIKRGLFYGPFYRLHLRSKRYSKQHESLLELEHRNNKVFYVAPLFHLLTELNVKYRDGRVAQDSIFIPPTQIGPFNDFEEHHVSFQGLGDSIHVFSEPREVGASISLEIFQEQLFQSIRDRGNFALTERGLEDLLQNMIEILYELDIAGDTNFDELLGNRSLLRKISYLAQAFFGSQVFTARKRAPVV